MGKYLQDIMIRFPEINCKGLTPEQVNQMYLPFRTTLKAIPLIEDLYNYELPKKFDTGRNIWRFLIQLTNEEEKDLATELMGDIYKIYCHFDNHVLQQKTGQEQKEIPLAIVAKGIEAICNNLSCSFYEFQRLTEKIVQKQIGFNQPYKTPKTSPNKAMTAQLWAVYTQDEKATFLKVVDKNNNLVLNSRLCDCHFSQFDRVEWEDNSKINVYKINPVQSYKRKKVAEDFYQVNMNGDVQYMPQTREAIFEYGVELMQEETSFAKGLVYIRKAEAMQHGKAKNILMHLQANPAERNIKVLMQQPDKTVLQKVRG